MTASSDTPPELQAVESFLNTLDERRWRDEPPADHLRTPDDLAAWLQGQGVTAMVGFRELALAHELRGALREMLAAVAGHETDMVEPPDDLIARFPFVLDTAAGLRPVAGGVEGALAQLLAGVAQAVMRGNAWRLKMCASADCRWVFYDGSRNGAGRWCSMEACGNREKTRAYRQRRALERVP